MDEKLLIIASVIVLVVVGIMATVIAEKKRRQKLQELALRLGFKYSEKDMQGLLAQVSLFHLFSEGRSRHAYNILEGALEDNFITIFDYRYTVGTGKHSHTYKQTVIWLN